MVAIAQPRSSPCASQNAYPPISVHITGLRYYSPELGRWASRDPIGRAGGLNLFAMTDNRPSCKFDYIGLTAKGMQRCEDLKERWAKKKKLPFAFTQLRKNFNHLMDAIPCHVEIDCITCCDEEGNKINQEHRCCTHEKTNGGNCKGQPCHLYVCVDNLKDDSMGKVMGVLVHELTHCCQKCRGDVMSDCPSCLCAELQAYHMEHPSLPPESLVIGAVGSCTSSGHCANQKAAEDVLDNWGWPQNEVWVKNCMESFSYPCSPN